MVANGPCVLSSFGDGSLPDHRSLPCKDTYSVVGGSLGDVRHAVRHGCAGMHGNATAQLYDPMPTKTTTQGCGGPWYRTEREAWIACRWAVCRKMANLLADLDELIDARNL